MLILLLVWNERTIAILFQIRYLTLPKNTILQLIQDGYEETKDQMKKFFETKELK